MTRVLESTFDDLVLVRNTLTGKRHIGINYRDDNRVFKTLCGREISKVPRLYPSEEFRHYLWKPNWEKVEPFTFVHAFTLIQPPVFKCRRCAGLLEEIRYNKTNEQIDALIYDNKKEGDDGGDERKVPGKDIKFMVVIDDVIFWCENHKEIMSVINDKVSCGTLAFNGTFAFDKYNGKMQIPMPKIYRIEELEYTLFCDISAEDIDINY